MSVFRRHCCITYGCPYFKMTQHFLHSLFPLYTFKICQPVFFLKIVLLTPPLTVSGLLTTAASATALCSIKALSTSNGPMRYLQEVSLQLIVSYSEDQYPLETDYFEYDFFLISLLIHAQRVKVKYTSDRR